MFGSCLSLDAPGLGTRDTRAPQDRVREEGVVVGGRGEEGERSFAFAFEWHPTESAIALPSGGLDEDVRLGDLEDGGCCGVAVLVHRRSVYTCPPRRPGEKSTLYHSTSIHPIEILLKSNRSLGASLRVLQLQASFFL